MRKFLYAALLLSLVFGTQSCSYRKLAYLQDMEELKTYDVTEAPDVRIRKNDKISHATIAPSPPTPRILPPVRASQTAWLSYPPQSVPI